VQVTLLVGMVSVSQRAIRIDHVLQMPGDQAESIGVKLRSRLEQDGLALRDRL
jgi:hypothetical protein